MRVDRDGVLHIEQPDGSTVSSAMAPELDWPAPLESARSTSGVAVLFGLVHGDLLVHVGPGRNGFRRLVLGERLPHAEQLGVHAVSGGFLVRFENGFFFVGDEGRERWRVDRVTFDWRFVAERDQALWLSDASGNLLGFTLDSGIECA